MRRLSRRCEAHLLLVFEKRLHASHRANRILDHQLSRVVTAVIAATHRSCVDRLHAQGDGRHVASGISNVKRVSEAVEVTLSMPPCARAISNAM